MDETDNGAVTSPEVRATEAARMAAEQLRAQARSHFETPTWIGPGRTHSAHAGSIPTQPGHEHDDLDELEGIPSAVLPSNSIPHTAHWTERAKPRLVAGTMLVAALAGVLAFLVLAVITQSISAIVGLVACAIVAVTFRGALMSSDLTQVDLKGSILRVRKGGVLALVNLADPMHRVELLGTPDQAIWRLRVHAVDGRIVELGPTQVNAADLHRIVEYYRALAARTKRDRERRFNR
jgi:hypothetical protein